MNAQQLIEQTNARMQQEVELAQQAINEATARRICYESEFAKLNAQLPGLLERLQAMHLDIADISVRKTGLDAQWKAGDRLIASITATPINNKFKFYSWKGYTPAGASKNRERCSKRAKEMQDALSNEMLTVGVNSCCLEDNRDHAASRILLSAYCK